MLDNFMVSVNIREHSPSGSRPASSKNWGLMMRALATVSAVAAIIFSAPASAEKRVVTADRYLDVATGLYVEYPAIFIGDDGRITSIADARTVKWGADVRHIDLSGRTLVPGLIDMHVHLDGPADIGGYRGLEFTDSFFGMAAVGNARAMLDAGFTTCLLYTS